MNSPKYSIITIVKNDKGISATLDYLVKNVDTRYSEIIVVDGSNGKLNEIQKKFPTVVWVPFISKSGKQVTIPEQRNLGLRKSKGDIIVFIDASCIPHAGWFDELTSLINSGEEHIVAGAVVSSTQNDHHNLRNKLLAGKTYLEEAPTINLAIDRETVDKVGYFDESFDYGSDVDYTMRAVNLGYKIRFNSKAIIEHDWGGWKDDMKRAFRYGIARVNIYKKHTDKLKNLLMTDYISLIYPLFIFFSPIALIWHYYPFILLIPVVKNYRNKPFYTTSYNLVYGLGILLRLKQSIKN